MNIEARVRALTKNERILEENVKQKTHELAQGQQQLTKSKTEIARLRKESEDLVQNSVELYRTIQNLEQRAAEETKKADDAKKQRDNAESEARQWYDRIVTLRQTMMELQRTYANMERGIEAVRERGILFRKGEELSRVTLSGGLNEEQARAKIAQALNIADVAAKERGVKPDSTGRSAMLGEIRRRLPDGTEITIDQEDQIRAFVAAIGGTTQDLLLIATAYYNYFDFDDRFVPVKLDMYINRQVYKASDVIAFTVIDGSTSDSEIFDSVIDFLRNDVRAAAVAAGMIPVSGQEGSLGEVTFQQMTRVVSQIRARGGPVKVSALASKNAKSAEPLSLKFSLSKP
jgi:hypothetical protein